MKTKGWDLGKDAARLDQRACLRPGTELAALLKRTKAKEECVRLEEPHGAASWGMGMQKPVGEAHGDQTAENRNENRLGPKGFQRVAALIL